VRGRLDRGGRLVAADPELAALQEEAGSQLGDELALPQVAAIARLARKLGVPISRPAMAAGADQDIDLWVRAVPEGEEVALSLERWSFRPPAPPRLGGLVAHEQEVEIGGAPEEWAADEDFSLVSITPGLAEKLGVSAEEAVGQPLTRLFRLEEDEDGELPLLAAATSRSEFDGQRARPRRGADEVLILRGVPVTGPDGRFAGFKGEALSESAVGGGAPASGEGASPLDQVIDEALRSPLDRIIESADRIVQQSEGPLRSDYADYATDIAAAARHLLSVIRSMSGEAAQDQDRVDLVGLANEAAGLLEAAAEPRGILIAVEPSAPLIAAGDTRGVIQILVNLVGNAVRHSPDGGTVALSFESDGNSARVHVADQGPGIDAADQQRIFERFERADSSEGGTGHGLAIARRLARSMGGDISLESAPGVGARFTLSLPTA
jgi:anti-sigma regulatory factor (Ser/Thr protein kinase)/PAS domain-containing protein